MQHSHHFLHAVAATLWAVSQTSAAQSVSDIKVADIAGHFDLAVPQSPAFTILGVTPESVVKSDDLRTIATGLLHGVDPQGNLQSGIALDVRPYLALKGDDTRLGSYQKSRFVQIASSLQLSYATASGKSTSDKADRQSLALNVKLWRQHDPALGTSPLQYTPPAGIASDRFPQTIGGCYSAYLTLPEGAPDVLPSDEDIAAAEEELAVQARRAIKNCLTPFKKRYWNAGSLELAVAGYHSSVDNFSKDGFGAWVGWSYGIGTNSQVVFRAAYADNRLVPPKTATSPYSEVDEANVGARFRFGSHKGTLMIEGMRTQSKSTAGDEDYWRATAGAELMVLPDIWIQFAVGKAIGTKLYEKDPVYSAQLRFGFSENSLFARK